MLPRIMLKESILPRQLRLPRLCHAPYGQSPQWWARLVAHAKDWRWSSVSAHLAGKDDELVKVAPVLERYGRFADFVDQALDDEPWRLLRMSETSGKTAWQC